MLTIKFLPMHISLDKLLLVTIGYEKNQFALPFSHILCVRRFPLGVWASSRLFIRWCPSGCIRSLGSVFHCWYLKEKKFPEHSKYLHKNDSELTLVIRNGLFPENRARTLVAVNLWKGTRETLWSNYHVVNFSVPHPQDEFLTWKREGNGFGFLVTSAWTVLSIRLETRPRRLKLANWAAREKPA